MENLTDEQAKELGSKFKSGIDQETINVLDDFLNSDNEQKLKREEKFINKVAMYVCASGPRPCPHHINQAKEILCMVKEIL